MQEASAKASEKMTDIVHKLRLRPEREMLYLDGCVAAGYGPTIEAQAATEIERLRHDRSTLATLLLEIYYGTRHLKGDYHALGDARLFIGALDRSIDIIRTYASTELHDSRYRIRCES